jgi:hypothetical protein
MRISIVVSFLLFLSAGIVYSQSQPDSLRQQGTAGNAEARFDQKNVAIDREFIELGKISGDMGSILEINGVVVYQPGQIDDTLRSINMKVKLYGEYRQEGSVYLDSAEIYGFAEAVNSISAAASTWKSSRKHFSEIFYITKNNFALGLWQEGKNQKAYGQTGDADKISCYFDPDDLPKLQEAIRKAIAFVEYR